MIKLIIQMFFVSKSFSINDMLSVSMTKIKILFILKVIASYFAKVILTILRYSSCNEQGKAPKSQKIIKNL